MEGQFFLCGAGISAPAPSSMPTVNSFKNVLLETANSHSSFHIKLIERALFGDKKFQPLRFEQIITCLSDIDEELDCLSHLKCDPSDLGVYNSIHTYLALQLVEGSTVITTNFDALIELALLYEFGKNPDQVDGQLFKIHGSLQTVEDGMLINRPVEGIKADIYKVSQGNSIDGTTNSTNDIFEKIDGQELICLGYSFSDSYDVNPSLERVIPSRAIVYDFEDMPLKLASLNECTLEGFESVQRRWSAGNCDIELWRGDVGLRLSRPVVRAPGRNGAPRRIVLPDYSTEELDYALAKMLFNQDSISDSKPVFKKLIDSEHPKIREHSTYYYLRCLYDYTEILDFVPIVEREITNENTLLLSYIFFLDAASFLANRKLFRHLYGSFRIRLSKSEKQDKKTIYEGRSLHCVGNYFFYSGRPKLARVAFNASKKLRILAGEPIDVFYSEYAICMASILIGELENARETLVQLRIYARKIGDIASETCIALAECLYLSFVGENSAALKRAERATRLIAYDDEENSIDPETEIYRLVCMIKVEADDDQINMSILALKTFVYKNKFVGFYDVVDDLKNFHSHRNLRLCKSSLGILLLRTN